MSIILITGGTGLIGTALGRALLERGHEVIILTMGEKKPNPGLKLRYAHWDIDKQLIDMEAVSEPDYIIHLAGAGVADKRWTRKRKQEIVDSRVNSSKLLVDSLQSIPNKVKGVISASAIGWYGPDNPGQPGNRGFSETAAAAKGFLGQTCKKWEESIDPVTKLGKRLVKLRTGIVFSKEGGALKEFVRPMKFGVAAILGTGKQVISWIHIDDLVKMYIAAVEDEKMNGVYNAVAPEPVSNKELTLELAKSRKRFYIPVHVPSFMLKLLLGEMSIEVLKSATVSSARIRGTGFGFTYPTVASILVGNR